MLIEKCHVNRHRSMWYQRLIVNFSVMYQQPSWFSGVPSLQWRQNKSDAISASTSCFETWLTEIMLLQFSYLPRLANYRERCIIKYPIKPNDQWPSCHQLQCMLQSEITQIKHNSDKRTHFGYQCRCCSTVSNFDGSCINPVGQGYSILNFVKIGSLVCSLSRATPDGRTEGRTDGTRDRGSIYLQLKNSKCDNSKTQIVTKLKNSNCDQTQKFKLQQNSKNTNCDKTLKLKLWQNPKI